MTKKQAMEEVRKLRAVLLDVQPSAVWISVKDRLPDVGWKGPVIFDCPSKMVRKSIGDAEKLRSPERWGDCDGEHMFMDNIITHWLETSPGWSPYPPMPEDK